VPKGEKVNHRKENVRPCDRGDRLNALSDNPENLVLGIDTGGTYTDAVLMEYHSRRVLATHKSLTTKRDFAIGIEQVIDGIAIDNPADIRMVSI